MTYPSTAETSHPSSSTQPPPVPRWKLVALLIFTLVASTLVSLFFGILTDLLYWSEDGHWPLGGDLFGGGAGLIAGWVWWLVMVRALGRSSRRGAMPRLSWWVVRGCAWGAAVGVLATVLLHLSMGLAHGWAVSDIVSNCAGFSLVGAPAGSIVGLVCVAPWASIDRGRWLGY